MDQPVTTFTLSQDAANRSERYTQAHVGRRSAIVLDGEILSVPVIEDVIRDSGQIRGACTLEEAQGLAVNMRAGALTGNDLSPRAASPVLFHIHILSKSDYRSCGGYNEEGTGVTVLNPFRSRVPEQRADAFL